MKYTEEQKELITAARTGDLAGIRTLINAGFDIDCELKYGSSALMIAASRGHTELVDVLAAHGAKLNRRNRFGATALMEASEKGHHDVVRKLVALGAEINLPHNNGNTALLAATFRRDIKTIRVLLELGADPEVANFDGWNARRWAESEANPALMDVFGIKHEKEHQEGEKTNSEESELTPPASNGKSAANDAFWTAFMRAASSGDLTTVRRLADDGVEINGQSPNGTTALMAAVKNGHADTVFELLEMGADLNLTDGDGLSALAWAARRGQVMIVEALKGKGASETENTDHQKDKESSPNVGSAR